MMEKQPYVTRKLPSVLCSGLGGLQRISTRAKGEICKVWLLTFWGQVSELHAIALKMSKSKTLCPHLKKFKNMLQTKSLTSIQEWLPTNIPSRFLKELMQSYTTERKTTSNIPKASLGLQNIILTGKHGGGSVMPWSWTKTWILLCSRNLWRWKSVSSLFVQQNKESKPANSGLNKRKWRLQSSLFP